MPEMFRDGCKHENFRVQCAVGRMKRSDDDPDPYWFLLEVEVFCVECNQQFEFIGIPVGLSGYQPTVSLNNLKISAPLMPEGVPIPDGIPGYSMRVTRPEQLVAEEVKQ